LIDPKRLPRESGYEVKRPAGVEAIPGYSGRTRTQVGLTSRTPGTLSLRWRWKIAGPARRAVPPDGMTYRKASAISSPSRAGQAAHHCAMKRYEQPIMMAPRDNAGLIGKAQAPHIERRGYWESIERWELRSGLRPKSKVRSERVCSFGPSGFYSCDLPAVGRYSRGSSA
jgi:hypothetical protein